MTDREKNLEVIMRQLLTRHFFQTKLVWSYKEDISLKDIDFELYLQIAKELPEVLAFHKED